MVAHQIKFRLSLQQRLIAFFQALKDRRQEPAIAVKPMNGSVPDLSRRGC